jgi:hypothetical protein
MGAEARAIRDKGQSADTTHESMMVLLRMTCPVGIWKNPERRQPRGAGARQGRSSQGSVHVLMSLPNAERESRRVSGIPNHHVQFWVCLAGSGDDASVEHKSLNDLRNPSFALAPSIHFTHPSIPPAQAILLRPSIQPIPCLRSRT